MAVHTNPGQLGSRPATTRQATTQPAVPRQPTARRAAEPFPGEVDNSVQLSRQTFTATQVEEAMRILPSHGWTSGWTGRRDRALLVLSQMAGLSYDNIAELTVANVTISDGLATIKTPGGTTTLRMTQDDLICGPCALARWLHALDMTAVYPTGRVIAAVIARCAPLTADSPHLCQGTVTVTEATRSMTLLNALNQPIPVSKPAPTPPRSLPLPAGPHASAAGKLPAQRIISVGTTSPIGLQKSDYAIADREPGVTGSNLLAEGLEGRARQLLEHRMSDVAGF